MENENKNTPSSSSQVKKGHNRRRNHKHKPYFITPNEEKGERQANALPVVNNGAPAEQAKASLKQPEAAQPSVQGEQGSSQRHSHRNRRKHKRNGDRAPAAKMDNEANLSAEAYSAEARPSTPAAEEFKSPKIEAAPKKLDKFSSLAELEKYQDYDEFSYEELYGKDEPSADTANDKAASDDQIKSDEPLVEVVGIKFKASGKTYYFDPNGLKIKLGTPVIVKTARGLEFGETALANTMVKESETVPPLRTVARIATDIDVKHHDENKKKEEEAFRLCTEKIIEHELDMKLIDAQYTFDNSKLLFYFTSSGRVDFRDLVKDLAAVFRTRIELRQIGIRDEAKMVGGLGLCGRPLCCSLFLTDFGQVSIKMAKEQNLSLNSSKISGICGRLMCCLRYEYDTYEHEIKRTPAVDTLVRTPDGVGTVTEISPLAGTIKVRLAATPDVLPKSYKREEVSILKKKHTK